MKNHRYKVSFSITTFIYVSLFLAYLTMMSQHFIVSQKEKDETIHLALSQFVPEVIEQPVVEEEIEPEPEPEEEPVVEEPIVEEEPEPEEPVVEEIIPEPVVKPIPTLKPVVKEVKKKPKPKKKIIKKKKKRKVTKRASRKATSSRVNPKKKSQFLAKIRAKINRAKSYPRVAKKRGMQGIVKVRFTILKNGRVGSISVSGPKVFHSSAKRAVKKAFPVNTKNAPLSLPETVNLTLRYQLR